jgi:uncharacterized membrane protein YdfJ with MMPL/SSD domain
MNKDNTYMFKRIRKKISTYMSKVEQVIEAYLEATGLSPKELSAVQLVQQKGAQTKGGKKLEKELVTATKKQDKNATSAARKVAKQNRLS